MGAVRRCAEQGFFGGESCPACADERSVISGKRCERLSRYLSGTLRHFLEDVDYELESDVWAPLKSLTTAAGDRYEWADRDAVVGIVRTDPKDRFERIDGLVRRHTVTTSPSNSTPVRIQTSLPTATTRFRPFSTTGRHMEPAGHRAGGPATDGPPGRPPLAYS